MTDIAELFDAAEPPLRAEFATSLRSALLTELADASSSDIASADDADLRLVDVSEARLGHGALPRKRLAVALAVAAALLVAVLVATASRNVGHKSPIASGTTDASIDTRSAPVTTDVPPSSGIATAASATVGQPIPGPLLVQPDVAPDPSATSGSPTTGQPGPGALIDGVLTHDDLRDCYLVGEHLAVFPAGTRLRGGVVVLPDAKEVPVGTHLRGGGAYAGVDDLSRIIGRSAGGCEAIYREVALFNPGIEIVGSSPEPTSAAATTTRNPGIVVATFDPMSAIELRPHVLAEDGRGYVYYSGGGFATEGRLVVADRHGFIDVAVPVPPSGAIGLGPDGVLYLVRGDPDAADAFLVVGIATRGPRAGTVVATSKSVADGSNFSGLSCAVEATGISCGVTGVRRPVLAFDVDAAGDQVAPMQHPRPGAMWPDADAELERRSFDKGQTSCGITRSGDGNDPSGVPTGTLTIDCRGDVSDGPPPRQVSVLGAAGVPMQAWDDTGLWYLRDSVGRGPDQLVFLAL